MKKHDGRVVWRSFVSEVRDRDSRPRRWTFIVAGVTVALLNAGLVWVLFEVFQP